MKRLVLSAGLLVAAGASTLVLAQQPVPPWTLSEAQLREIVGRVRAGQDLSPKSWPGGARVAVGLSFDLDNETGTLRDSGTSPALFSTDSFFDGVRQSPAVQRVLNDLKPRWEGYVAQVQ